MGAILCLLSCGDDTKDEDAIEAGSPEYTAADTLHWNLLVAYLQEHFDDFHDVTMRYHHQDHTINGTIMIRMTWEDEVLKSAEVLSNETGSEELPLALIDKMTNWQIEGLDRRSVITLPVKVKLVGLDDPEFPNTAMLTGEVTDSDGNPLPGAIVSFMPRSGEQVLRTRTNREGIFVMTLIPPGVWDLECLLQGYGPATKEEITLSAGDHARERFTLGRNRDS
jgi:hypothetical protein